MINSVIGGKFIQISGGSSAHVPKSYSSNQYMTGDMRYDLDSQCIKVFDGATWQALISSSVQVSLNHEAESLLEWVRAKRHEEIQLQELAKRHPAVADAVTAVTQAQEKLRMVAALVDNL